MLPYSFYLAPGGLFITGLLQGGFLERGLNWGEGGLIYSSKKPAMEIISLNCNKLKIITQYISYNNNIYVSNITTYNIYDNNNMQYII